MATCEVTDCAATAMRANRCLGHMEPPDFKGFLQDLRQRGDPIDGKGTTIAAARIARLLAHLRTEAGVVRSLLLTGATIKGSLAIERVRLTAPLDLRGAVIRGDLVLANVSGLQHVHPGTARGRPPSPRRCWFAIATPATTGSWCRASTPRSSRWSRRAFARSRQARGCAWTRFTSRTTSWRPSSWSGRSRPWTRGP